MANLLTDNRLYRYVKESRDELRNVTWPTRQRVLRDTIIVIALSLAVAAFFAIADYGFAAAFQQFIAA